MNETTFQASALQCRRAYEVTFGTAMPGNMTYKAAGEAVIANLGHEKGKALIRSQSNKVNGTDELRQALSATETE